MIMGHIELPIVKMSLDTVTPTRATEGSVGLDFYSPANYIIPPHSQLLVPTQIKLKNSFRTLWQTSLKIWLGHITSTACGSRSYRPRLYGRNYGLVNEYCLTCSSHH